MPLALTWYEWFKTGHVLAAVLWVGGGATLTIYAFLTVRRDTPEEQASMARKIGLLGERFYAPLSLLVLGFGFGLMENGQSPWSYDQFFVVFALVGWALSFVTGAFFLGPESKRPAALMSAKGPEDPEVGYRIRRILAVARLDIVLLVAIVFVMTAKPWL
jgi:uncharacterized membrane protein